MAKYYINPNDPEGNEKRRIKYEEQQALRNKLKAPVVTAPVVTAPVLDKVVKEQPDTSQADAMKKMLDEFKASTDRQKANEVAREKEERKALDAGLASARAGTISAIDTQSKDVTKQAQEAQHISGVRGRLAGQSLQERIAQKGLAGSAGMQMQADTTQATLNRARGIQGQESDAQTRLGEAKVQAEKDYQTGIATGNAQLKAQSLNRINQIDQQAMSMGIQMEQLAYDRTRQAKEDAYTEGQRQELAADKVLADEVNLLEATYGNDYTARINELMANDPTNAMIPYLHKLRQAKVGGIASAQEAAYDTAMDKWKLSGVVDVSISGILGVPVGTPTTDKSYKDATVALNSWKAQDASNRGWAAEGRLQAKADAAAGGEAEAEDNYKIISSGLDNVLGSVETKEAYDYLGETKYKNIPTEDQENQRQALGSGYIATLYTEGSIDADQADKLALEYGISTDDVMRSIDGQSVAGIAKDVITNTLKAMFNQ